MRRSIDPMEQKSKRDQPRLRLAPGHRLDESPLAIPWRVALQQSPPPLRQQYHYQPRGAATARRPVEAYNLCDEPSNQFRPVLAHLGTMRGRKLLMLPTVCFEAGRLPKLNLPPAPFEPMRANECLVPVDRWPKEEDSKTGRRRVTRKCPASAREEG